MCTVAAAVAGAAVTAKFWYDDHHVELPEYEATTNVIWLDQNWTKQQREWFYHADQGTRTFDIPYEWFLALEQPSISPLIFRAVGLFSNPDYLDRLGFIPASIDAGLPIGFARGGPMAWRSGSPWQNPRTKQDMTGLGLTCAACHTGRLTYRGRTVVIDGGPALTNFVKLKRGIGISLIFTRLLPFRFDRFADRILGPDASGDDKAALKAQLDDAIEAYFALKALEDSVASQNIEEGYGRLDALNRIGNTIFATDLDEPKNYVGHSAPVHFARIWNAQWVDWVQYNASIERPMVRNAGEALGVGAMLNLTRRETDLFASSVQVKTLVEIEKLIAGNQPNGKDGFSGLKSPEWPKDILPPINQALAAKGAELYSQHCQRCHLPPVSTKAFFESTRWLPANAAGERYLEARLIDIKRIGTDPAYAESMATRQVSLPGYLNISTNQYGPALGQLVEKVVNYWYDQQQPPISETDRQRMNGNRDNGIRSPLAYKVRPLNGVWATPPYLHNGSVPNIYALLSPVAERPKTFHLGNREYDPVNVGYRFDKLAGGFLFDTSLPGNKNTGHEFSDEAKEGVIGPKLSPDERRALVEYIKTL